MLQSRTLVICMKYYLPSRSNVILACHTTLQLWKNKCFLGQSPLLNSPSSTEEEDIKDAFDFTGKQTLFFIAFRSFTEPPLCPLLSSSELQGCNSQYHRMVEVGWDLNHRILSDPPD